MGASSTIKLVTRRIFAFHLLAQILIVSALNAKRAKMDEQSEYKKIDGMIEDSIETAEDEKSKSITNNLIAVGISLIGSVFTALSLTIWKVASMRFDKMI